MARSLSHISQRKLVTVMRLKVDLQCPSCYKKVKKILCKFPQIRDQVYDEKQNLVTITVVCCSPEKIRDKLCCKGGKVIKSIEIVKPPPPPKPEAKEKPKPPEKPPKKPAEKPKDPVEKPTGIVVEKPKDPTPPPLLAATVPTEPYSHLSVPAGFCCVPCSEGYRGGPCYYGYGQPVPPPPYYYSYGYGYGKGYPYSRCDYFSEENTGNCTII
nr:protein PYRICULARIA ORYZAE RESISTANCE 21-like isoform X1 [Coffea arabica]